MQTVVTTKATHNGNPMTSLASKPSPEWPPKPSADLPFRASVALPSENPAARGVEILRIPQITIHIFCDTPSVGGAMERALADGGRIAKDVNRDLRNPEYLD